MGFDDHKQVSLEGSLILADPSLRESTFHRSVLLLTNHSPHEGAHGYILNRPTHRTVGDLIQSSSFKALYEIPVFMGGPVNTEQMTFSSLSWNKDQETLDFEIHLSATEATQRLLEGFCVRAFIGYAGWSEGQLESELKQRAWIPHRAEACIAHSDCLEDLWGDILRRMSPWHRLLADAPDDPGLN